MASESIENHLKIWQKLTDVHMFHENLKQNRLRHFVTVQIGLSAAWAFVTREYITSNGLEAAFLIVLAILLAAFGFIYSEKMHIMNERACEYIKAIKNQIQDVEKNFKPTFPNLRFLPYQGQYEVLSENPTHSLDASGYKPLKTSSPRPHKFAYIQEQDLITILRYGWIVLAVLSVGFFGWRMGQAACEVLASH